jgi:hypothetical protein
MKVLVWIYKLATLSNVLKRSGSRAFVTRVSSHLTVSAQQQCCAAVLVKIVCAGAHYTVLFARKGLGLFQFSLWSYLTLLPTLGCACLFGVKRLTGVAVPNYSLALCMQEPSEVQTYQQYRSATECFVTVQKHQTIVHSVQPHNSMCKHANAHAGHLHSAKKFLMQGHFAVDAICRITTLHTMLRKWSPSTLNTAPARFQAKQQL